jgi:hypothetical protein
MSCYMCTKKQSTNAIIEGSDSAKWKNRTQYETLIMILSIPLISAAHTQYIYKQKPTGKVQNVICTAQK